MATRTTVLVHGNPETSAIWGPLIDALAERGRTTVALSPPGFGAPVPDGFDPTMDAYAEWLVSELERVRADGSEIDLLGHDWGAGHVYGALSRGPDLVRTWTGDIAGVLHRDYVWHDMAQAWQTPDIGEQVVAGMASSSHDDKVALFEGLGLPTPIASALAAGLDDEMGRCVLRLYRTGAQPAVGELGDRLAAMELPPGLVIDATEDAYVASALSVEVAERLGAEVLRLEGRGHWWMTDDVGGIADSLLTFWSAH
ncbi:MAG TPA: alpha/beta hydrolase [Ilumatobacteraceae bacterium]|nr:alpha/beta hydrolase [Ilumatobacteraceae bacterium]